MPTLYLCIAYSKHGQQPLGLLVAKQCACLHPYLHQRNHSCLPSPPLLVRIQVFNWQGIAEILSLNNLCQRFWTKRGLGKICLLFKMRPSIHPNPLIAYAVTSVSDSIYSFIASIDCEKLLITCKQLLLAAFLLVW